MATSRTVVFKRVLVHVDTTRVRRPALERAVLLAKATRASLRLVDVLVRLPGHAPGSERIEALAEAEMRDRLNDAAAFVRRQQVPVTTGVQRGDVADALVEAAADWRADLLLRSHGIHQSASAPIGPTDSQLLRRCPCPVWFVTPRQADGEKTIVAAVDPDPDDADRQQLAVSVVQAAMAIANASGAALHVVHAWSAYGHQLVATHGSRIEAREFIDASHQQASIRLNVLLEQAGVPPTVHTHLLKGRADVALTEFVASRRASLVVIGTVGRTGLAGLIVGNTAERVLRDVRCSVLALKPSGPAEPQA